MKYEEPVIDKPRDAEILVIGVDCGEYAAKNLDKFTLLRDVATRMARHRLLYSESVHDFVGVFKLGSKETKNKLADNHPGGYGGIELIFPAARRSLETVRAVHVLQPDGQSVDFLDVLEAIGDHFSSFEGAAAKRKRVALFTHSTILTKKPCENTTKELMENCDLYRDAEIQIDVICVDWRETAEIDGLDDDDDNGDDTGNAGSAIRPTSYYFERAEKLGAHPLWAVARATGGIVLSAEEASEEVDRPKAPVKRPVARFRGTLDIGKQVKIPVKTYINVLKATKETAIKLSWAASRAAGTPVGVHVETLHVTAATDEEPLEREQLLAAYPYGTDLVPIQTEAEESWAHHVPRGISTIAFISRSKVPVRWFMSAVSSVIAMPGVPPARRAMDALVEALHAEDKGILARVVTSQRGGAPIMAFLWPAIEVARDTMRVTGRFLYMAELPLREDVRNYPFASLHYTREGLPAEAGRAMDAFIDCRRLDSSSLLAANEKDGDDEEEQLELDPAEHCNPSLDRFCCAVIQRALDGPDGVALPPIATWQKQLLDPKTFVGSGKEAQIEETLKNLKITLPVAKVPVKERGTKKVAEALTGEAASITDFLPPETGEEGEVDAKNQAGDMDGDLAYLGGGGDW